VPARIASVQQLPSSDVRRIAVGNPKTSSVGKFALQVLRNYRLDEALKSRYVFAEHSAAVLHLVATGEADVGFVYRTDTIRHNNIRVLAELPDADHSPILYGLGTVWTAKSPSLARKFGDFLLSQPIQGLLKGYGFEPVSELATLPQ
jgi:molybdate transport system substrate-binding protein